MDAIRLPHDWAIAGPFDQKLNPHTGALPISDGLVPQRAFTLPVTAKDRRFAIEFDGAMSNATVWLNGKELGQRPYGYIGFGFDLTPLLKFGGGECAGGAPDAGGAQLAVEPGARASIATCGSISPDRSRWRGGDVCDDARGNAVAAKTEVGEPRRGAGESRAAARLLDAAKSVARPAPRVTIPAADRRTLRPTSRSSRRGGGYGKPVSYTLVSEY